MTPKQHARRLKKALALGAFRLRNITKQRFACPVCGYAGPFRDLRRPSGVRRHAVCPGCYALERHRIQFLVLTEVLRKLRTDQLRMIHFAPETFFRRFFAERFGRYETADLQMQSVDHHVDLENLPFPDACYDFVFASHVLEHIPNDRKAIAEIRRILKPDGIAILPVPIVGDNTIEYPEPNPYESNHVRAPGLDYFERFKGEFAKVELVTSESFPETYQLFICEDRSRFPTPESPLRTAMAGDKHIDIVPICYA